MIEVSEQLAIPSPPAAVWDVLSDPRAVADCIPGASLEQNLEDGMLAGMLAVKFGPLRVSFACQGALELDAESMTGTLTAKGRDSRGGTRFKLEAGFHVEPAADAGSAVALRARVELAGRLASVIESGAGVVVEQMTSEFGRRLAMRSDTSQPQRPRLSGDVAASSTIRALAAGIWRALRSRLRRPIRNRTA